MEYGFGIDIGGTTVKISFFDCKGILLNKWEIKTNTANGGNAILPDIAASAKNYLIERNIPAEQIIGIGVGVPGPVDDNGIVNKCVNLGWGKVDLQKELTALTGFPVKAGNDANVAAIKGESGSWKWALFTAVYTTVLAWVVVFAIYQIGGMFG